MRLSTTHLKIATTLMMILCVVMMLAWPLIVGQGPATAAPRAEHKAYALKFVGYISVVVVALILSALGALAILRRTAAEFKAMQMDNMRDLIESTLKDHKATNEPRLD